MTVTRTCRSPAAVYTTCVAGCSWCSTSAGLRAVEPKFHSYRMIVDVVARDVGAVNVTGLDRLAGVCGCA